MIILALDRGKFNTMCCLYISKTMPPPNETNSPRSATGQAEKTELRPHFE